MSFRPDDPHWEGRDRFLLSHGHYAIAHYAAMIEAGTLPEEELETYGCDDSRLPMSAAHHGLSNLICMVDINNQQVDGNDIGAVLAAFDNARQLAQAMPGMTVIDPCDALEIEQAVPAIAAHPGPVYMRLLRGQVPLVLDEYGYKFELGKAKIIRDGTDVLFISSGLMTMRALEAAQSLKSDQIDAAVLHVPTLKPLDTQSILREAARPGRLVVVAENHSVIGGLGEAVAGVLMRAGVHPAFRQIALPDAFLAAGALPTLHDRYGISTEAVVSSIKSWL
jgi:deoxyxylulose-5-phosphate synthase